MKDKNYLDDIKEKSLNDLIQLADNTIKNLENKKDLENSIDEYQKLITINNLIQKRFQSKSKEITEDTKIKIKKILKNEKQFK